MVESYRNVGFCEASATLDDAEGASKSSAAWLGSLQPTSDNICYPMWGLNRSVSPVTGTYKFWYMLSVSKGFEP